jgi:hypothetical protein
VRSDSEKRRRPRARASETQAALLINGSEAKLVDFSSGGLRVQLQQSLIVGLTVQVSGEIEGSAQRLPVGGPRFAGARKWGLACITRDCLSRTYPTSRTQPRKCWGTAPITTNCSK